MKTLTPLVIVLLFSSFVDAEKETHHEHVGSSSIKLSSEFLDFENSKKKNDGKRYGVELDHQDNKHHYRLYYEKTDTKTTDILPSDLKVNKYALKYIYRLNQKNTLSISYIDIHDNLMKETDGGHIYGVGYQHKMISLTQYFSDYKHFDVYQSDIKVGMKTKLDNISFMAGIIGKYIHLKNKESSAFTKKADTNYFSTGLKLHAHYDDYHLSAGTYVGKRIFAVMNDGLKVQHHSMEFKESYLFDMGKEFDKILVHLRYGKHRAKEVPIANDNVNIESVSFEVEYQF